MGILKMHLQQLLYAVVELSPKNYYCVLLLLCLVVFSVVVCCVCVCVCAVSYTHLTLPTRRTV